MRPTAQESWMLFLDAKITFLIASVFRQARAIWPPIWRDRREETFAFLPAISIRRSISD